MIIYAISGLGADYRVFQFLHLDCQIEYINWIEPLPNESLSAYSLRLSNQINTNSEFGLMGVSFGGLVATEISKVLNPKLTILISSAETMNELGPFIPFIGRLNLLRFIPSVFFDLPRPIAPYLFGTNEKKLLNSILNDSDNNFTKWALSQLTKWSNTKKIPNCLKICGTEDKLIPPSLDSNTVLINGGAHIMVVDKANQISGEINAFLKSENLL